MRWPRAELWAPFVVGLVIGGGLWNLQRFRNRVERYETARLRHLSLLVGLTLSQLPDKERRSFLERVVRSETAVYAIWVDASGTLQGAATAFPGYLPLRAPSRTVAPDLRARKTPLGTVLEIRTPLPEGDTLFLGTPYFLVESWLQPLYTQGVLTLLSMGVLLAALLWLGIRKERAEEARRQLASRIQQERSQHAAFVRLAREVAHEMKTPLSVISLSLQHMERESDPDRLAPFIQTLRSQVDTLVQRVQTLLDQETPLSLNQEPISTTDMMQQLERLFAPAAAEKRVSLQVEVEPGTLYGDREWLLQALVNAFQNALEAAPPGSTITLRCRHSREGWTCSIQDQGPGIPPDQADLVFLPGYSSKPGGTGIGLSVVRRVVEAHGGKVWMEHPPEGGTRLMMHFPDRHL